LPEAVAAGASAFTRSTQRNANTHVCSLHDAAGQRAVMRRLTPSAAWLRMSWLATGARGAPRWVGATCNAYAEVASMRQRSWQCTCARSQSTYCRAGSRARSGGTRWAGRSTCAAPPPSMLTTERTGAQSPSFLAFTRGRCSALSIAAAAGRGAARGVLRLLRRAVLNSLASAARQAFWCFPSPPACARRSFTRVRDRSAREGASSAQGCARSGQDALSVAWPPAASRALLGAPR